MGQLELFLPEATILLGAIIGFVLSVLGAKHRITWIASVFMAAASVVTTCWFLNTSGEPFFAGIYKVDGLSQFLKLGITGGLLLTLLASSDLGSFRTHARVDFPVFLMFSALGMMMLVSATELLTLYVALELSAYGLYIISALHKLQRESSEAAAKYMLFGAASSAVSLYGISLIYGGSGGTTYLTDIAQGGLVRSPMVLVGLFLALAGVLFKLAVFPFHAWAADTYQAAPHQASTFIGTASKVAAVGVLARLLFLAAPAHDTLVIVLLVLCVASMTIGNLAAIVQNDLKRLLAYSTVAHAGYILIGLLCFSSLGLASALFYVIVYVPIVFCAFLVVCVVGNDGPRSAGGNPTKQSIAGLYHRSPLLAATMLVGMFGLAGIPPTVGFAGKWFLFSAAIDRDLFWLVIVGAVNATVSLYYYLRIIKEAYLSPPQEETKIEVPLAAKIAAWIAITLVIATGFYPRPIWELAETAARAIAG